MNVHTHQGDEEGRSSKRMKNISHCEWLVLCSRWDSIHLQSYPASTTSSSSRTTWYFSFFTFLIIIVVIIISPTERERESDDSFFIYFSIEFTSSLRCVESSSLSTEGMMLGIVWKFPYRDLIQHQQSPLSLCSSWQKKKKRRTRLIFWNNIVCP